MRIPDHVLPLIEKFLSGNINANERKELNDWYRKFNDTEIDVLETDYTTEQQLSSSIKQKLQETIINGRISGGTLVKPFYRRWHVQAVAAILLLMIGTGAFFYFNNTSAPQPLAANAKIAVTDIAPGTQKAILVLDDGRQISLDDAKKGRLENQGNSLVEKTDVGTLQYSTNSKETLAKTFYNTVTTPRGGEYHITLADGTKVWLNAASSIRFPTSFNGNERGVQITGEVYFEVTKNPHKPFKVKAGKTEVEVLGTHFNVNAYNDEAAVKTSLLEGSVKVSTTDQRNKAGVYYLQPGSQARVDKNGGIDILKDIDTEEVMAWKNNLFIFKSTDLRTIMRQISRWYDVDIAYKGNVDMRFTGQIVRNSNVSRVFEMLKLTGAVDFSIVDKTIVITKAK
ncbi:MAG: hypothetical protein RL596_1274 [Bacteroidota bacterium]